MIDFKIVIQDCDKYNKICAYPTRLNKILSSADEAPGTRR
jgi:hypothetical protein